MIIYGLLIRLYYSVAWIASFFSPKAEKWIDGRKKVKEQLAAIQFSKDKWVWFHCSSFGEFQDGRDLMEGFKRQYPGIKILLTFFSPTGYELQKNYHLADCVCYLPLDTASNAAGLLNTVKPVAAFFIRNDIWPNYVAACSQLNIPCFLISFTLNAESKFIRFPLNTFFKKTFQLFNCVFVHNSVTQQILSQALFSNNIIVSGNSRVDRCMGISKMEFSNELIEKFIAGHFCVIAGSTHSHDRKIFIETCMQHKNENIKWIIVPHEIDRTEIEEAKKYHGHEMVCYSQFESYQGKEKLLWVDHVGMLAKLYRYADIAFIGGGFTPQGVHSILEPAVYGCPVCFGPNYRSYVEATDMLNLQTASIVRNSKDLSGFIFRYKNDTQLLADKSKQNKLLMAQQAGATNKILNYLKETNYFV